MLAPSSSASRRDRLWTALGAPIPFDPQATFVTSPFFSPSILAVIRLTIATYTLSTICVVLAFDVRRFHSGDSFLSYFTELSYIGLCAYYWAAAVQTTVYAASKGQSYPLERWPRFLQFLHSLLYSSVTVFPFIVTIVFWTILADDAFGTTYSSWSNLSQHALNTPFAAIELLLTSTQPQPWIHLPFLILLLALYLSVAYITRATQGFYVYSFLDPGKHGGVVAGYVFGIAVGCGIVFAIAKGVVHLRCWIIGRITRKGMDRPKDLERREALDEWETVERDLDDINAPTRRIVLKTSREAILESEKELGDISVETDMTGKESGSRKLRESV